jgi:mannose-6-phosphate isomerase-like protein (cupin superfamily)
MTSSQIRPAGLQNSGEWLQPRPGERFAIRTSAAQTEGRFTILEVVADPGYGVPMHGHRNEDEHFIVLEGTLRIANGDTRSDAPAGTALTVGKGVPHAWRNPTDQPVRFLAIFSPGNIEGLFREVAARTSDDDLAAIGARFGCFMVGPPLVEDA